MVLTTVPSFAAQQEKFIAKLTGDDEVPPKDTKARGSFEMALCGWNGIKLCA
jgi:hypothetical protein